MRFELNDNTLTLFLEGELNSYNAENVEKEIESVLAGKKFDKLNLDFANLRYISSAGLRIILKLKQQYNDVSVIETSLEVYDIFSMTGFTNIMTVKKALRRVYISGAQIVGEGYYSTVYRINKDTIIKVFNRVNDPDQIERELKLAKQAFMLGIPTAISFDIVKVDDKLGVCFEMLDCKSLKEMVIDNKDRIPEFLDKYAALLKQMNTTECFDPNIPNKKAEYLRKVEKIKQFLPEKSYLKAKKLIESVPERRTLIHGDCHFKNIMVQKDELLLIDMDTLSVGYPIFELGALYFAYRGFNEDEPDNSIKFFGIPEKEATALYEALILRYFGKDDPAIKGKIRLVAHIQMLRWTTNNEPENKVRYENVKARLIEMLDQYDDLDIGL
ncbi:MAG: anti-sigma factor antagonist [Bacilli bacterium]|nr:anti-sigma factor antagonist [Bacilli bacterium]